LRWSMPRSAREARNCADVMMAWFPQASECRVSMLSS
jgi:hypothetical protein